MANLVRSSLLSVGAFVVLAAGAVVGTNAAGLSLSPADSRMVLGVLAIAALFVGFNA